MADPKIKMRVTVTMRSVSTTTSLRMRESGVIAARCCS
jgi:hypothetical protein